MSEATDNYAEWLVKIGLPAPWRLDDENVGGVLAANSAEVFVISTLALVPFTDTETQAALAIITAVNTCAGFKASIA